MNAECWVNCPKIKKLEQEHWEVDYAERHSDPRAIATSLGGRTHYDIKERKAELAKNCSGPREVSILSMVGIHINACQSPDK